MLMVNSVNFYITHRPYSEAFVKIILIDTGNLKITKAWILRPQSKCKLLLPLKKKKSASWRYLSASKMNLTVYPVFWLHARAQNALSPEASMCATQLSQSPSQNTIWKDWSPTSWEQDHYHNLKPNWKQALIRHWPGGWTLTRSISEFPENGYESCFTWA